MAATALSSQLQALAGAGGQLTTTKARTKASLLYSPSQAADVDLQTISSLAQSGLNLKKKKKKKSPLHSLCIVPRSLLFSVAFLHLKDALNETFCHWQRAHNFKKIVLVSVSF